jgi:hypothetical protein
MEFIKELNTIRNKKLAEICDENNKKQLDNFLIYITTLFIDKKTDIHNSFTHYVINNPRNCKPSILREYTIDKKYANGFELFFTQEGGKYVKEFITQITESDYKGFHITIKNNTVYPKGYTYISGVNSQISHYTFLAWFEINFGELKELLTE